jgi:hypothetical protein
MGARGFAEQNQHADSKIRIVNLIENKNQFAPQVTDPKELKNHQKQIKQDRFVDKVTAGYQSKLLDNIRDSEAENGENGEVKVKNYLFFFLR